MSSSSESCALGRGLYGNQVHLQKTGTARVRVCMVHRHL